MYIPTFQIYISTFQIYIAAIILLLDSCTNANDLRYWQIVRENGNIEMCCFCSHQSLRTGEHVIPECKEKFGKTSFPGYFGHPICSCLSSQKYPQCSESENVCGRNIQCPKRKVYENCRITGLLTEKIMRCNDSLKWEYDLDCIHTCTRSNKTEKGFTYCMNFGNVVVCNITCKSGFYASPTTNLECAKAKAVVCSPEAEAGINKNLYFFIPGGILLIVIILSIKFGRKCVSSHPVTANVALENGNLANGHIANGNIGIVGPGSGNEVPGSGNEVPGSERRSSYDSHRGPESLKYDSGPRSLGIPDDPESLQQQDQDPESLRQHLLPLTSLEDQDPESLRQHLLPLTSLEDQDEGSLSHEGSPLIKCSEEESGPPVPESLVQYKI